MITKKSLEIVEKISDEINNLTFHHHYHILYDLGKTFNKQIKYLEIGCYGGASTSLMLHLENIKVKSIDLGKPISSKIAKENINKFNKNNNEYEYIEGSSFNINIVNKIEKEFNDIDILFIDGDHTYSGVQKDFYNYSKFVNKGGYIVFDDYMDTQYSPEVKSAVDDLITLFNGEYEIIGCLENIYGARPKELKTNNCFIIKKI